MSLTSCSRKAGEAFRKADKGPVFAKAKEYRAANMGNDPSGIRALRDQLEVVQGLIAREQRKPVAKAPDRGTTEPVTNPKDVVGNSEGGRSADDYQPGTVKFNSFDSDERAQERLNRIRNVEEEYRLPNIGQAVPKDYVPKEATQKTVTIYRGVPASIKDASIRPGDWVGLSKKYAADHGTGETGKSKVISIDVPADHVVWAGTDMNEWFYAPRESSNESTAPNSGGALASPTQAEVLAQQQRKEDGEKAEAKAKKDNDKKLADEQLRKEMNAQSEVAAKNFELGQDPADSLAGQDAMFDAAAKTPAKAADVSYGEAFSVDINSMFAGVPYRASEPVQVAKGHTVLSSQVIPAKTQIAKRDMQDYDLPATVYAWRVAAVQNEDGDIYSQVEAMTQDSGRTPQGEVVATFTKLSGHASDALNRLAPAIGKAAMKAYEQATASVSEGGMFANEPTVDYTGNYETDLFGNALPKPAGKNRPARSAAPGVRGDVQPATDTPAPRADYYVNTIIGATASRELGADRILTAEHAAQATRYLYKSAVERMDGIVTDKSGKPLAVIGGFKGAVAETSVYPATLMGEAIRIPGAARVWFSHNHPSGSARLSKADINLNETLTNTFRGSGIEPMGLLAIAGDQFAYVDEVGSGEYSPSKTIPPSTGKKTVPVMARELGDGRADIEIEDPTSAKRVAQQFYKKAREPGVLLLNSRNSVAAWLPVTPEMKGPLRGTGGLSAIYRAISQSNAGAAIIVHGGELDAVAVAERDSGGWGDLTASENIGAALKLADVRTLDSINVVKDESAAERGRSLVSGPAFARGTDFDLARYELVVNSIEKGLPYSKGQPITLGKTPDVLQMLGAPALPFSVDPGTLAKAMRKEDDSGATAHALSAANLRALPQQIADPIMVFKSKTQAGALVVLTELSDAKGKPVVAAVHLEKRQGRLVVNQIVSVYGRNISQLKTALADGDTAYVDNERAPLWATTVGLQLPWVVQPSSEAKTNFKTNTDLEQFKAALARQPLDPEAFSRTFGPARGMATSAIQKAVDELTAKWKSGPTIKIVATPADLPVKAPADARGLIHGENAYIVAANNRSRDDVARTLGHEAIGHYGLWKMLGADGTRQFQRNLQLALKTGNVPLGKIRDKVRGMYLDGKGKFNLTPAQEANEIAAFAVEDAIDPVTGDFKPGFGFVKSVYAKIAEFLRGIGIDVKFTNAELQGMLVNAAKGLEAGKRLDGGGRTMVAAARGELQNTGAATLPMFAALGNDRFTLEQAVADASRIAGFSMETPIRIAPLGPLTFQEYDPATDTITINSQRFHSRGQAAEALVEEWLHALDNASPNRQFSAGSERLAIKSGEGSWVGGGDIAKEAIAQINTGSIIDRFLRYPLMADGLTASRTQAELFARLGVLYIAHNDVMKRAMPTTYEAYRELFESIRPQGHSDAAGLQGQVRITGLGSDAQGLRQRGDVGPADGNAGKGHQGKSARRLEQGDLVAFRGALVRTFGARSDGGLVQGTLSARTPDQTDTPAFARGGTANLFQPNIWSMPDPTRMDSFLYEAQDAKIDLKRAQQAIVKSGQKIEEKWDARLAETLYPGRVAHRSKSFLEVEAQPLLEAMSRNKVEMAELADYLHARGAEERNIQIAKVNPSMPDGGAGTNSQGVLLTNQAARDYLANVPASRKVALDALAAKVDAITAGTRRLLVTEGLEKQDTIDAWEAAYQNYVPMFRDEAESGQPPHPQGSGFSVKGSASKRATGSTKAVTNILAHVLMQREAAITRAEKNRVALALYGQALSHPNPDFWTTIKPGMTNAAIAAELVAMGVDPLTAEVGMEGAPTLRMVDPITNKVVNRTNPMYRNLPGAIPLKVNGEDRVLMLNVKHPRGQRLAASLKNLDGLTQLDLAGRLVGRATRWLAAVNTQYNPAFGLVNLTRDVLGGVINLGSTELRGNALKVLAQTPGAIFGIARELATGKQSGKWGKLYQQFVADGGQTGFKDNFRDPNERAKAIKNEMKALGRSRAHPGKWAHLMLDLLDGFNTTLENAVRVSAYSAAIDKGMSRPQAARLGRELTVDFNRKGRMGREVGPLYAFFNASVQGSARTIQTLKGPTGVKVIAGGLGLGVLQAMMLAAAGYDDDEIPEWVKTRALIIPLFGDEKNYIAVPYPLGLHVIPNTGRVLTELVLSGGKNVGKRSVAAIGEIAGGFNPLGGGNILTTDGFLRTLAPTLIDPVIEIATNKNFAGTPIEKRGFGSENDNRPGVNRVKLATQRSTTGQAYIEISEAMNWATGGTDYEAGAVSPTPEMVRYLAQTAGGGVLREIEKSINASTAAARGDKVKSSQIPVMGRFYGEVDDDSVQTSRYYNKARDIDKLETSVRAAKAAGDGDAVQRFLTDNQDAALITMQNKIASEIRKLNKMAVATVKDPERQREIDELRVARMSALNQAVDELERQSGKQTLADKLKPKAREPATAP